MREIRYFGANVDPAEYRRGFGFWGFAAFMLNKCRMILERATVLAILRVELRLAGITGKEARNLLKQARANAEFVPVIRKSELPRFVQKLIREPDSHIPSRTEERYSEGRKNGEPTRPIPIEQGMKLTLAQYEKRRDRSTRYVASRKTLIDHADHVEVVSNNRRKRDERRRAKG